MKYPDANEYPDPIVFALAYNEWLRAEYKRSGDAFNAFVSDDTENVLP